MRTRFELWPDRLRCLGADNGDGGGGGDPGDGDDGEPNDPPAGEQVTMSQADLDKLIERRLRRARTQWEKDADAQRDKDQQSETDRLKAEKDEAERAANAKVEQANRRAIAAEARIQAVALGVKPERVNYAVRLADLGEIEVDDDGEPDAPAIKAALEAVIRDVPELKSASGGNVGGGGSNPPGGDNTSAKNPWSKEHFNLTEQARILREDPAKALRLKQAAKG